MSAAFSRRNARRLAQATLRSERQPRNAIAEPQAPRPMLSHCYVYSAGGATALSGATLGAGTGLLQAVDASGVMSTITPNITISFKNVGGAITGPAYLLLGWANGRWTVVVVKC